MRAARYSFQALAIVLSLGAGILASGCGGGSGGGKSTPVGTSTQPDLTLGSNYRLRKLRAGDTWNYVGMVTPTGSASSVPASLTITEFAGTLAAFPGITGFLRQEQSLNVAGKSATPFAYYLIQNSYSYNTTLNTTLNGDIDFVADGEGNIAGDGTGASLAKRIAPGGWPDLIGIHNVFTFADGSTYTVQEASDQNPTLPAKLFTISAGSLIAYGIPVAVQGLGNDYTGTIWWSPTLGQWVSADLTGTLQGVGGAFHFDLTSTNVTLGAE